MDKNTFEKNFWGDCCNTLGEELKQFEYARFMGLLAPLQNKHTTHYKRILDIGGGPVSMLLKCSAVGGSTVVDPLRYPLWVMERYRAKEIGYYWMRGEDIATDTFPATFDEVWIYNCLQHTDDPERIIENARSYSRHLRIFEWIDIPTDVGHPQELSQRLLEKWVGVEGAVADLTATRGGKAFYYSGKF